MCSSQLLRRRSTIRAFAVAILLGVFSFQSLRQSVSSTQQQQQAWALLQSTVGEQALALLFSGNINETSATGGDAISSNAIHIRESEEEAYPSRSNNNLTAQPATKAAAVTNARQSNETATRINNTNERNDSFPNNNTALKLRKTMPKNPTSTIANQTKLKATSAPIMTNIITDKNHSVKDFEHQPRVAIVTKIHSNVFMSLLKQSLCLLHAAYNRRVLYDIIIFTTIALSDAEIEELRQIVKPAVVAVHVDEQTLQEQLADLTTQQQQDLVGRCAEANTTADLTWGHRCKDHRKAMPLAYTWMSEFRSKQIWTHKALRDYKYMLWFDSDAFPMSAWKTDPIAYMIRENLVLFMANYGQSKHVANTGVQDRVKAAYNKSLCETEIGPNGRLWARYDETGKCAAGVKQVHGFFHITDLDFYRLPQNLYWQEVMIGNGKFQRTWDDQLAVIVPAAMLAPERTAEMGNAVGVNPQVMHNAMVNGKRMFKGGGYVKYFQKEGRRKFPEAFDVCRRLVVKFGR